MAGARRIILHSEDQNKGVVSLNHSSLNFPLNRKHVPCVSIELKKHS